MLLRAFERFRHKEVRRAFAVIFSSKILGVLVALLAVKGITWYLFTSAFAEDVAPAEPPPFVNPINTMWTLIAAFLVFFMQAGFMALEAGFSRTRETVNILL